MSQELENFDDENDDDIDSEDFGFIIDADGNLKSVMLPETYMGDPPLEVKRILKIFGIKNINNLIDRTIH